MTSFFQGLNPASLVLNPTADEQWKQGIFAGVTYNYLHIHPTIPGKATFLLLHGFPNGKYFLDRLALTGKRG